MYFTVGVSIFRKGLELNSKLWAPVLICQVVHRSHTDKSQESSTFQPMKPFLCRPEHRGQPEVVAKLLLESSQQRPIHQHTSYGPLSLSQNHILPRHYAQHHQRVAVVDITLTRTKPITLPEASGYFGRTSCGHRTSLIFANRCVEAVCGVSFPSSLSARAVAVLAFCWQR